MKNKRKKVMPPNTKPLNPLLYNNLKRVSRGGGVVFLGMIFGMLFGLLSKILIARWTSPEFYGIFALGLGLTNIFAGTATLGLSQGTTRYVAYYKGKDDVTKVRKVIFSSIQISLISGIIFSLVLYTGSNFFAVKLLHNTQLSMHLRIFSLSVIFTVLMNVFIAIFRGSNMVEAKAYFDDILRNLLFFVMVAAFLSIGMNFTSVIWAYSLSFILTFAVMLFFMLKKQVIPKAMNGIEHAHSISTHSITKDLMLYSLPVFAVGIMGTLFARADTLMLGYFMTPTVVGYYNAAYPIANLIPVVMSAISFALFPVLSEFYAKGAMDEMQRMYMIITKWNVIFSFSLFLFFFVFPQTILRILFGSQYAQASVPLQIIVLAVFLLTMMGPTDIALQAVGETKFIMKAGLIGFTLNLALNFFLIPPLGMIGAAIAYLLGRNVIYLLQLAELKHSFNLNPFDGKYLKTIFISILVLISFYLIKLKCSDSKTMLILSILIFIPCYGSMLYLIEAFCKEDFAIIKLVRDKIGKVLGVGIKI